jgi:hypothetical protein
VYSINLGKKGRKFHHGRDFRGREGTNAVRALKRADIGVGPSGIRSHLSHSTDGILSDSWKPVRFVSRMATIGH